MYNVIATCYPRRKNLIDSIVTWNTISYFYDEFERFRLFSGFEAKPKTAPGISGTILETKVTFFTFWKMKMRTVKLALTQLTVLYISMKNIPLTLHPRFFPHSTQISSFLFSLSLVNKSFLGAPSNAFDKSIKAPYITLFF